MDGIDAVVVQFAVAGSALLARVLYKATLPYSPQLRSRLGEAVAGAALTARDCCQLDTLVGQQFAAVAATAVAAAGPVDLVCSHGQTVYHWVEDGSAIGTLQLGQPAFIAAAAGAPVVGDVRAADIAVGGQGAPLVPIVDVLLLHRPGISAALNLGGIANITVVQDGRCVAAYDTGPANALIDAVAVTAGLPGCDVEGRLAAKGSVHRGLLDQLLSDPYFQRLAPKTTGKEYFHLPYLRGAQVAAGVSDLAVADLAATVTALTAITVSRAVLDAAVAGVYVSGGGLANRTLMNQLRSCLEPTPVASTAELGVDPQAKEALAFALIGWLTAHGLPGNVPAATGANREVILGSITALEPPQLPAVLERPPKRLIVEDAL